MRYLPLLCQPREEGIRQDFTSTEGLHNGIHDVLSITSIPSGASPNQYIRIVQSAIINVILTPSHHYRSWV